MLPQAWSGQPFTHEGSVYRLPTLGVRPTPSTRIPVLVGGGAEPAIRRAARLADGIFSNAPTEEFREHVGWVLDELEQADRDPASFRFIHYSILLPGATRADALARYRDAVWALNWKYSDMEASAARPLPAASPPLFDGTDESLLKRRTAHAGTADELVEALLEIRNSVPVTVEFVARSHLPFLEYDAQVEVMQRLAEGVAPHV
jgi:alkanesulfonate monooxygenase SsuD/methylene tetrahydromethanopterin reductase-like flavin-dependent oxidoreductase (luciferase family)